MTLAASLTPQTLAGAAPASVASLVVLSLGAPVHLVASGALTKPGFYMITAPGLTLTLDPAARLAFVKDTTGTATIAAPVDGSSAGLAFRIAGEAATLLWDAGLSTWLRF